MLSSRSSVATFFSLQRNSFARLLIGCSCRETAASIMTLWTWILMITKLSCVRARSRQTYFVYSIIPVFDIIDGQTDTFKLAWRQSQTVLSGQFLTIDRYEAKWAHISHPSPWNASEPFLGISRLWRTTCVLPVLLAAAAAACDLLCCVWWWWQKKPSFSITDANEYLRSFHNHGEDQKELATGWLVRKDS